MSALDRHATSLRFVNQQVEILDQRLLPHEEQWHRCESPDQLIAHIHSLAVRGAPLIGIAASLMVAQRALAGVGPSQLLDELAALRASRPTAVNLMNYLDRLRPRIEQGASVEEIADLALAIFDEDRALCQAIGDAGLSLIPRGSRILTHCNTGSLATAGIGTALGIITHAHSQGHDISVWVDETRPLLQGSRLTTWELSRAKVPHTLICDNMAASLMAAGEVDLILVGADRIAANGDTANKIGTYALAVLAKHHGIPFYCAAPVTTIDPHCPDGSNITIEQRNAREVRGVRTAQGELLLSPAETAVHNPAFDVTPATLVSAWITDRGVHHDATALALTS